MDTNFSKRFSDYKLIDKIIKEASDFKNRSLKVGGIKVVYYLLIIICISVLFIWGLIGVTQSDITKFKLDNLILTTSVILSLFVMLIFFASVTLIGLYKKIIVSEFQNLLFSSGILTENKAFMILSSDKQQIIYMDPNSRSIFKRTNQEQSLESFITDIKIDKENQYSLSQALLNEKKFDYIKEYDDKILQFSFLPLSRPKHFYVIKLKSKIKLEDE